MLSVGIVGKRAIILTNVPIRSKNHEEVVVADEDVDLVVGVLDVAEGNKVRNPCTDRTTTKMIQD